MRIMGAGIYDKFASALSDAVKNLKVGDGFGEGVVQVYLHLLFDMVNHQSIVWWTLEFTFYELLMNMNTMGLFIVFIS